MSECKRFRAVLKNTLLLLEEPEKGWEKGKREGRLVEVVYKVSSSL